VLEVKDALSAGLGDDHPDTRVCQADLAATLRDCGLIAESEELVASALTVLERVLGSGHPDLVLLRAGERISRDLEPQLYLDVPAKAPLLTDEMCGWTRGKTGAVTVWIVGCGGGLVGSSGAAMAAWDQVQSH
jgi:hypothetical protein